MIQVRIEARNGKTIVAVGDQAGVTLSVLTKSGLSPLTVDQAGVTLSVLTKSGLSPLTVDLLRDQVRELRDYLSKVLGE